MSIENNLSRIADALEALLSIYEAGGGDLAMASNPIQMAAGVGAAFTPGDVFTGTTADGAAPAEAAPKTRKRRTKAELAAAEAAEQQGAAAQQVAAGGAPIPMPGNAAPIPGFDVNNTFGAQPMPGGMPPIPGVAAPVQQAAPQVPNEVVAAASAYSGKDAVAQFTDMLSLFSSYSTNQAMRDTLAGAVTHFGQQLPLSNANDPSAPGERWVNMPATSRQGIFEAMLRTAVQIRASQQAANGGL